MKVKKFFGKIVKKIQKDDDDDDDNAGCCGCLKECLRQSRMTRFYIKQRDDPHGPHIAIYVANLPTSLSQRQYEHILVDIIGKGDSPPLLTV